MEHNEHLLPWMHATADNPCIDNWGIRVCSCYTARLVSFFRGTNNSLDKSSRPRRLHSPIKMSISRSAAIGQLVINFNVSKQFVRSSGDIGLLTLVKGSESDRFHASKNIGRFHKAGYPFNSSNTQRNSFHKFCEIIFPINPVHKEDLNTP